MDGEKFQVFAINCAHLGCPVRWFPQSGLFMCPCHGGVYYSDGSRASGPPERGLFEYRYKVEQGNLLIQAGRDAHPRGSHGAPYQHLCRENAMRLIKEVGRLVRSAPAARRRRSGRRCSTRSRARPQAGLTSLAARRSLCSCSSLSPAFFSLCFMCPPPEKPGTACRFSITRSRSAGSFGLCTAGARIS